jgi:hypothetical protein
MLGIPLDSPFRINQLNTVIIAEIIILPLKSNGKYQTPLLIWVDFSNGCQNIPYRMHPY